MRLIKLEILNLASLDRQEGEVICFEEGALKDSTIFSIVGPTGSGKSTLLDAICLALYNRAPRYPRKKGDRNQHIEIYGEPGDGERNRLAPTDCRNILTRGKKEGYSKLTFLANNGQLYRAEWQVKFMQVKFAPVVTLLYKLSEKDGVLTEEAADWEELPLIIGLDYEQFLRTVLIAQGSFANFLTAKENERYELLEKLVGCEEVYARIATEIKAQRDRAVKDYERVLAHLTAYEKEMLTEEELLELQEVIGQLEAEERRVKEAWLKTNEALTWFASEEGFATRLRGFQQEAERVRKDIEGAQEAFGRLKRHDETGQGRELLRDVRRMQAESKRIATRLEELQEMRAAHELNIRTGEDKAAQLKEVETAAAKQLEAQRPHINRARTLLGELETARRTVQEKERTEALAAEACQKAQQMLQRNETEIVRTQQELEAGRKAWQSWLEEMQQQKQALEEEVKRAAGKVEKERAKLQGADAEVLQAAKEKADADRNDLKEGVHLREELIQKELLLQEGLRLEERCTCEIQAIEQEGKGLQLEELKAEVETLQKSHTLMTSENWTRHRKELTEGKPCPLCGAHSHPYSHEEAWLPVVGELEALMTQKKGLLEERQRRRQELTERWGVNNGKLQGIRQLRLRLRQEADGLTKDWNALTTRHPEWRSNAEGAKDAWPDVEELERRWRDAEKKAAGAAEALTAYHRTQQAVERKRQQLEEVERRLKEFAEEAENRRRTTEQKLVEVTTYLQTEVGKTAHLQQLAEEKKEALTSAQREVTEAKGLIAQKQEALNQEVGPRHPDEWEEQLTRTWQQAGEAVNAGLQALAKEREELKALLGQQEAMQSAWKKENAGLKEGQEALDRWLAAFNKQEEHPPMSLTDLVELAGATDDWEGIRQQQTKLLTELTTAETTLTNEVKAHEAHQLLKPEQPKEAWLQQKTALEAYSPAELTEAKARRQRHEAAQKAMGKLYDERQESQRLKEEWEEMTEAIGGDGKTLRKIAQCYTLRFLIEHANTEIRKFNSRYELQQVKNSLGIRIIDHDRADDVRDTTSLSGGETFIVSLGLALGLSALSSRHISFENLFIDEGFGTLDPDTLATVIDSLAMLQTSQGKKVGVISHTDTMSERITTQIRIIKNGHSGSSHLEIYP